MDIFQIISLAQGIWLLVKSSSSSHLKPHMMPRTTLLKCFIKLFFNLIWGLEWLKELGLNLLTLLYMSIFQIDLPAE